MSNLNSEFTKQILSLKEMAQYLDGIAYMIEALNANVTDFDFRIKKNSAVLTIQLEELNDEIFDKFTRICQHDVKLQDDKLVFVFKTKKETV